MNQKKLEKEIIELYEQVACQIITPNQARKGFLSLIQKEKQKMLGEIEREIAREFGHEAEGKGSEKERMAHLIGWCLAKTKVFAHLKKLKKVVKGGG